MSELTSESPTSPPPKADLHKNQATSESPTSTPPPPEVAQLHSNTDLLSDVLLWRRKQLNVGILAAAAATWIVIDVYQYTFITVLSWLAMALLTCFFFWGNMHRFLNKEAPDLSELEISEETATAQARLLRQRAEDGIRLMFHVGGEREWFVFLGAVASLYLVALAAQHLDFVTLCFIGILGAMTVPAIYVKNEQKIVEFAKNVRVRWQRLNVMIEEKLQKVKNKFAGKQKEVKEKKTQ
ncbi:reticulon-like protein B13 [Salvia miltiorrhiza]|uniref:reticulon-like protein B13 n=1 Tax=Salvia miltiorrhiza TaxID=226208 RepID=UPI0025AC5CD9|nr:reticulon-like protein B13 [Salvia miltiorrhiza]